VKIGLYLDKVSDTDFSGRRGKKEGDLYRKQGVDLNEGGAQSRKKRNINERGGREN